MVKGEGFGGRQSGYEKSKTIQANDSRRREMPDYRSDKLPALELDMIDCLFTTYC